MFNRQSVVVVGAGASCEANLPDGRKLTTKIGQLLNIRPHSADVVESGDKYIWRALAELAAIKKIPATDYLSACWRIRDAMPAAASIDNYIDSQDNELVADCGKLAIVRAIWQAEQNSDLFVPPNRDIHTALFPKLKPSWFTEFFSLLVDHCRIRELQSRLALVTFIVFNYDRCIEHFLWHSLQNYYQISEKQATEILQSLSIIHPYGVVGQLPWQTPMGIPFGADPSYQNLIATASSIRTYTEATDDESVKIIGSAMLQTKRYIFLGFGFHPPNMTLIAPDKEMIATIRPGICLATAKDQSKHNIATYRDRLMRLISFHKDNVLVEDCGAEELMRNHRAELSMENVSTR